VSLLVGPSGRVCHCGWEGVSLWVGGCVTVGGRACHCGWEGVSLWVGGCVTVGGRVCHCGWVLVGLWYTWPDELVELGLDPLIQ
jgi:hypothetical protein